jgi:hypothetical protein
MCELIISVVVAFFGTAFGFSLSILKDRMQRKASAEERFFYEIFPKRLAVYDNVIKEFHAMMEFDLEKMQTMRGIDVSEQIIAHLHKLNFLTANLRLFGSRETVSLMVTFSDHLQMLQDCFCKTNLAIVSGEDATSLHSFTEITFKAFVAIVEKEALTDFIDNGVNEILKRFREKDKKTKSEMERHPNDQMGPKPNTEGLTENQKY